MRELRVFLAAERRTHTVFPADSDVFCAFDLTPLDQVRVVILGQDPYIRAGQAHGPCFSVRSPVRPPPSLRNIHKELHDDLGLPNPTHGDLTSWARQGVLLLNSVMTVREGVSFSHAGRGWERFTDRVIEVVAQERPGVVFLLWGRPAADKAARVSLSRHHVLKAAHPSPMSARRGFFGCRHFSRANDWLREQGQREIDWALG